MRTSLLSLLSLGLLAITIVRNSESYRISEDLNKVLQEKCGKRSYQRKVINGEGTHLGEHPWAASVYVKSDQLRLAPGTIISHRHVISFNVIRSFNDSLHIMKTPIQSLGTCDGAHLIVPTSANHRFDVDFEYLDKLNSSRAFTGSVSQVTVVNGCKTLNNKNLMILELHENMRFNAYRRPSCVSNSPKNFYQVENFVGYGVNRSGILVTGNFAPATCTPEEPPFACATALDKSQGLCTGDFGGSAIAQINEQYTMLGMYSKGNIDCQADPATIGVYKYINVGYFRKEICQITGVCVAAPPDESEEPEEGEEEILTSTAVGEAVYATEEVEVQDPIETTVEPEQYTVIGQTVEYPEADENNSTEIATTTSHYHRESSLRPPGSSEEEIPEIDDQGTIVAETFEKLKLNGTCAQDPNASHVKNIHIHIHLNK